MSGSSASSSTRWLNASQDSSRSRNRSSGSGSAASTRSVDLGVGRAHVLGDVGGEGRVEGGGVRHAPIVTPAGELLVSEPNITSTRGPDEARALVGVHRDRVLRARVEDRRAQAAGRQVVEAQRRQRAPEARGPARPGRRRRRRSRRRARRRARPPGAPWSTPSRAGCPSRSASRKPAGSNHGSGLAGPQVRRRHPALLRVVRERAGVHAAPRVLVATRHERPHRDAGRQDGRRRPGRAVRSTRICSSSRTTTMPAASANARARRQVAVRPDPQRRGPATTAVSACARASSARPTPGAAVRRVDDELGPDRATASRRRAARTRRARRRPVRAQVDHRRLRLGQPQQRLLGERGDAVGGGGPRRPGPAPRRRRPAASGPAVALTMTCVDTSSTMGPSHHGGGRLGRAGRRSGHGPRPELTAIGGTPDARGNARAVGRSEDRVPGPRDTRRSRRARDRRRSTAPVDVTVVVIGAGQAGLSAAYHLRRAGLVAVGERGWERRGRDVRRARRRAAGRRRLAAPVARPDHGRRARRARPARHAAASCPTPTSRPRSPCRTTSRSTRRRSTCTSSGPSASSA